MCMLTLQRKRIRRILLSVLSVDDENDSDKEDNKKRKIPTLVMWYLLVIDHLKHVFSNPKDAELVY
jgi:predicted AlkP superfamily pyrophosphatase or phosphodiesterase